MSWDADNLTEADWARDNHAESGWNQDAQTGAWVLKTYGDVDYAEGEDVQTVGRIVIIPIASS